MFKTKKDEYLNKLNKIIESMGSKQVFHAQRVRLFTQIIVDEIIEQDLLANTKELLPFLKCIPQAAYYHDIGKSKIHEDYWYYADLQSDAAIETYREHVEEGFKLFDSIVDILELDDQDSIEMSAIMDSILEHHERYDGKGFPNHLSGNEISYAGRITAVADQLEYYLSSTKYKEKISLDLAIDKLQQHKGTRFDPVIVNALVFAKDVVEDKLFLSEYNSLKDVQLISEDERPMEVEFRPIFNVQNRHIASYEATLKLYDSFYGKMYPQVYLPIAEKYDLDKVLTEWYVTGLAKEYHNLEARGIEFEKIYFKMSMKYLSKKLAADQIISILDRYDVNFSKLTIEITESMLSSSRMQLFESIEQFKRRGITIALYEFGAEYSTLNKLDDIPADEIILARDFSKSIESSTKQREVVRSLINLAKAINITVMANGIENRIEEQVMKELGVSNMMGNFYGEYVPAKYLKGSQNAKNNIRRNQ